jgi:hypothetical protein
MATGIIFGPINDNDTHMENEDTIISLLRCTMKLDIVRMIKIGRLMWIGQNFRIQELDLCRKLTFLNKKDLEA